MSDLIDRQMVIDAIEEMQMPIMRSEWSSDQYKFSALAEVREKILQLPSAQPRMTCDGCKYANHPTGWSDVCVLCIRNFRNFKDRYER